MVERLKAFRVKCKERAVFVSTPVMVFLKWGIAPSRWGIELIMNGFGESRWVDHNSVLAKDVPR